MTTPVNIRLPGTINVEILPRGLTIHKLILEVEGKTHDIVIGPEEPEDHVNQKYTNTIVGRYVNRIPVGKHILERNGVTSEFEAQANENPRVSLHGGPVGFDSVLWSVLPKEEAPQLFSVKEFRQIQALPAEGYAIFRLISPDGFQGYPGELITEVLIAVIAPTADQAYRGKSGKLGHVVIVYRSKLTGSSQNVVTPVNLTQHWGFNLDASLRDRGLDASSVKNHELTIQADSIAGLDDVCLSTGNFIPISEVPEHAHNKKLIGEKFPSKGYDDFYLFKKDFVYPSPSRISSSLDFEEFTQLKDVLAQESLQEPSPAQLFSKKSGIELKFFSNQRGVMFYSNNLTTPEKGARKIIHGGSGERGKGDSYGPGTAAFLEFHDPLTAFLDPKNRDAEDTLLTSGEIYNNFVRLEIGFSNPI